MRLQAAAHAAVQRAQRALDALLPQAALQHGQAIAHGLRAVSARGGNAVEQLLARAHHHFSGGRRRGRAQVGHEIRDGDVGFVSHGRDHRHGTGGDGPRHGLLVEGPQIFQRSAAAAHNDHIRPLGLAEELDAAAHLFHRALALHQRGEEADVQSRKAPR